MPPSVAFDRDRVEKGRRWSVLLRGAALVVWSLLLVDRKSVV